MSVGMVGIDHNRADLDIRGLFSFTKKKMEAAYRRAAEYRGLSGNVILSTCNRMEWWFSTPEDAEMDPAAALCRFLGLDPSEYGGYLVTRRDREAVGHLFRLAAGLESKIIGEDQILTQVGDALQLARANYAADNTLEVLFRRAVTAGKRVKTETAFTSADRSVIDAALRTLAEAGFDPAGKRCMVIGNGMMGKLSAQALLERGADVTVTVRQYTSGVVDIPRGCGRINYAERYELLPQCELVVSATSSPNLTLTAEALGALSPERPVLLIDLAVPRDIDPAAGALPGFTLYDIDAFHIDPTTEALRRSVARAEEILREEEAEFYRWYEGRDLVPRIRALKAAAARDVNARLTPAWKGIPLPPEEKAALEREIGCAAERMMNRLLFGLRDRLPESVFSECIGAMEFVFNEK